MPVLLCNISGRNCNCVGNLEATAVCLRRKLYNTLHTRFLWTCPAPAPCSSTNKSIPSVSVRPDSWQTRSHWNFSFKIRRLVLEWRSSCGRVPSRGVIMEQGEVEGSKLAHWGDLGSEIRWRGRGRKGVTLVPRRAVVNVFCLPLNVPI